MEEQYALLQERVPESILQGWDRQAVEETRIQGLHRRTRLLTLTPQDCTRLALPGNVAGPLWHHWGVASKCDQRCSYISVCWGDHERIVCAVHALKQNPAADKQTWTAKYLAARAYMETAAAAELSVSFPNSPLEQREALIRDQLDWFERVVEGVQIPL